MLASRWLAGAFLFGAIGLLAGCSGGGSDSPTAEATASSVPSDRSPSEGGRPDCPPPDVLVGDVIPDCEFPDVVFDSEADANDRVAGLAEVARRQGNDETVATLADGKVTVAERRQANQDALDCMTEQGMVVRQFEEYDGLYGTEFTFNVAWGTLSEDDASQASTECEGRFTVLLERAYGIQHGNRFTERTKAVLQACLERFGSTDDVGDTLEEFLEIAPSGEAALTCQGEAEQIPPLPGDPTQPAGG